MNQSSQFEPVRKVRAFEIICEQVRTRLSNGSLKAGDKLPAERELAAQFQVSRTAVREALRTLEMSGIIRNEKGVKGGAFIQTAEPNRIAQTMQDYVYLANISLDELTEARFALQDEIIKLACERAAEDDFELLEQIATETRDAIGVEARYECAQRYYTALAQSTQNRIYLAFVNSLSKIMHEFVLGPNYDILQDSLLESRFTLVRHLRNGDCEAARTEMRLHLQRVHDHVLAIQKITATRKP